MSSHLSPVDTAARVRAVATAEVAALPKVGEGVVEAYVSMFNVEYRMGYATWHKILPGAFDDSIAEQAAVPVFWAHAWDWSEQVPIGHSLDVDSDDTGLRVRSQLYVEETETARAVYRGMQAGALREWSIGYGIVEHIVREERDQARRVLDVSVGELLEASSVLRGANPETQTLNVAGAPDLAGLDDLVARHVAAALAEARPADEVDPQPRDVTPVDLAAVDLSDPRHRALIRARHQNPTG